MIVTMRSWTDLDSEQRRRVAREDRRRLRLAFGLALGLQAGFLALTGALMAEPQGIPIRLEGGEAPMTVMLLAMDAGRTARLAPATAPASAPSVKAVPHPPVQPTAPLAVASPPRRCRQGGARTGGGHDAASGPATRRGRGRSGR